MIRTAFLVALVLLAPAVRAQTLPDLDRRVGRLETDMRAVKRRVLPDREARLIEPEIGPAAQTPLVAGPDSPTVALTERVDALERQQRRLTAQLEEQTFKLRQLEETLDRFRKDAEFRLTRIETPPVPALDPGPPLVDPRRRDERDPPFVDPERRDGRGSPPPAPPLDDAPGDDAEPLAAATPEDEYRSAYELVAAKDYARAEPALTRFIAKYPKERRASHARYWLGRSYYAQGQWERSARAHADNYQADVRGERAQESVYWIGQSLVKLGRRQGACDIYDRAFRVYADEMKPALKPQFETARADAGCS